MRLFIALDCKPISDSLRYIQENLPFKGFRLVSSYHITLKFLGEVKGSTIPKISKDLSQIRMEPITVALTTVDCFPNPKNPRILWVGVSPHKEMYELKKRIDQKLQKRFTQYTRFIPHITIARINSIDDKKSFYELLKSLEVPLEQITFKHFKLLKSTLTKIGPIYEEIARFPE